MSGGARETTSASTPGRAWRTSCLCSWTRRCRPKPALAAPDRAWPITPDPLWYKDAVIYQAHVRAFFDSTDDGVGDFPGLTQKLDYLESLGVNTPVAAAVLSVAAARRRLRHRGLREHPPELRHARRFRPLHRGSAPPRLRVITELVINHTSDQHPWFQAARRAPAGSPEREFYVWSDTNQKYQGVRIIFTDTEKSNWAWDDTAKAYYWHRFFHHQPDLNFDNPAVLEAVIKVMRFWLDRGVDGLRLDAVPYLIEREGHDLREPRRDARHPQADPRARSTRSYPDRMLLAEANQWPADVRPYFGDGDECHMAFHFPLMPRMFMAVRQEDRHPIVEILRQTPDIPENCQWAMFLRNHDELTLEMVTDEERDYMYQAYAADPQMRINVGIRRRLAPLLENSRRRIELLHGLLFSMPGTPVIYYGDEIGMGDNIYLGDRNGVRTPMQWTGDRNAGFSRADPARLFAPPIMDPVYGYQALNVEAQSRSPFSMLNWMRRMIGAAQAVHRLRPRHDRVPARAEPQGADLRPPARARRRSSASPTCRAACSRWSSISSRFKGMIPVEMLGLTEFPRIGELPYFLTIGPYAFYWFRLQQAPPPITAPARAGARPLEVAQAPALLAGAAWETLLEGNVRTLIERERLLPFLQRQRWFGGKARRPRARALRRLGRAAPRAAADVPDARRSRVRGRRARAVLPAAARCAPPATSRGSRSARRTRCWRRSPAPARACIFDAWLDDRFAQTLLEALGTQEQAQDPSAAAVRARADRGLRPPARPGRGAARHAGPTASRATPRSSTATG